MEKTLLTPDNIKHAHLAWDNGKSYLMGGLYVWYALPMWMYFLTSESENGEENMPIHYLEDLLGLIGMIDPASRIYSTKNT